MLTLDSVTDISHRSKLYRLRLNYSGQWRGKECIGAALLGHDGGLSTDDNTKTDHLLALLRRFNPSMIRVDDESI